MGRSTHTSVLARVFAVAAALIALVALTASALAQPQPSHRFYGSGVTIDGEAAPAGTSISAWVDGEVVGSTTTAADGSWFIDVAGGATVAFSVGDLVAEGTHESSVGGQSNVALAVTTPPPPPPPEPECPDEGMMDEGMMDDGEESMMDEGEMSEDSMMDDGEESMMGDGMAEDCPPVEMDDCPDESMMDDGHMADDSLEGEDSMMDEGEDSMMGDDDSAMAEDCPEEGETMEPGEGEMEEPEAEAGDGEVTVPTGGSGGLAHEGGLSAGLVAVIAILSIAAVGGAGFTAIRLRNRV